MGGCDASKPHLSALAALPALAVLLAAMLTPGVLSQAALAAFSGDQVSPEAAGREAGMPLDEAHYPEGKPQSPCQVGT